MNFDSDVNSLILMLQKSRLYARCIHCNQEFKLSAALLFNGRGSFPAPAEERRQELETDLTENFADLVRRKEKAQTLSENATVAIGIGKIIEKVLPAHKDFSMISADCRFLAEPIDMIVFNGVSQNKVDSITFMDIKTGGSKLNTHQKQIRDAIEDKKVKWKVL